MLTFVMAVASVVGMCTVETDGTTHRTRCRVAADDESVVAVPIGRRTLAPNMLDVTLEIVTPGYAVMRNLTPGGINSASGELLMEQNGSCWTDGERRICLGRAVPRRTSVGVSVPVRLIGDWRFRDPEASTDLPSLTLTSDRVPDTRNRGWRVTRLVDHDGVATISGVALDDGKTVGNWTVAIDPDGDLLLLGFPNALPSQGG